jgi:excisionase family DNA binding protein
MTDTDQILTDNDLDEMLTDKEVAGVLKLSRSSVWRLAKLGKLPQPMKVGIRTARWKKSELKAWMEAA